MADAKRRKLGRWALGFAAIALAWLVGVWPPPLWWREHDHPAPRKEPLSVGVAQSAPQAQGGGDGCVARARAAQGPHPRAVSQRGGVGAGDLGGGRCKPGLLRRRRRGPRRAAGGGPRRHAIASPHV